MKKIFLMMALAATALFTVTSCDKKDDDDNSGKVDNNNVELTAPPYLDVATVINITQDNAQNIKQLRMMESGAYMITRESGAQAARLTRGEPGDLLYEFGKYTYNNGKYVFDNGMTISFEPSGQNYEITIMWKDGTTIKTTGTINKSTGIPDNVITRNLCSRPWTIERLFASGKFGGVKLGKEIKIPVNLADIKAWFEENGGKLKDQFDANTIILGIFFDSQGLFTINYQNRDADVGVWRWSDMNNGKLSYNWNDKLKAISLFTGSASVSFEKSPERCKLVLNGNVDGYDIDFTFTLK